MTGRMRLTAWLACLSFVSGLLLADLHRVTAVHGYCTDHGELIHLPLHGEPAPVDSGEREVQRVAHVSGVHDCVLLSFRVTPTATPPPPPGRGVLQQQAPALQPTTALVVSVEVLRQAPKGSPPAA